MYKIAKKDDNFYCAGKLSDEGCAVHSPRISPDGNYLVWLQRETDPLPHHNVHKLMFRDLRLEDHVILY